MRIKHVLLSIISVFVLVSTGVSKEINIGKPAPNFTLTDSKGEVHSLKDYRGKYVVLEWINYDCPFVKKHYNSGNMQALQKKYTAKDVVWLAINSSAKGKQGNFSTEEIMKRSAEHGAAFSAYLMDADGMVGKWYGAKTTPHMFIINPEGKIEYAGAIDDIKSTRVADVDKATNYIAAALDALLSGEEVTTPLTKPYGCSVKY